MILSRLVRFLVVICCLISLHCDLSSSQTPPRVMEKSAFCDESFIYFTIRFDTTFTGYIYSEGTYEDPTCRHVDGTVFPTNFYNVTIPLNRCGSQLFVNGTKRNVIIVQRDPRILEIWDNKYILTCTPRLAGGDEGSFPLNGQFTVTMGGINVDGSLTSSEVVTNQGAGGASSLDYTVEVQDGVGPNGPPVQAILRVGRPISYVVKLNGIPPGGDARIGRCWASDQVSQIQLSDDQGCSVQREAKDVWNNFQTVQSGTTKIFYNNIKTWAFPTSNNVNIFCNLHMCRGVCPAVTCQNQPSFPFSVDQTISTQERQEQSIVPSQISLPGRAIRDLLPAEPVFAKALPTRPSELAPVIELEGSFQVEKLPEQQGQFTAVDYAAAGNGLNYGPGLITGGPTPNENTPFLSDEPNFQNSVSAEPANGELCLSKTHYILIGLTCFLVLAIAATIAAIAIYKLKTKKQKNKGSLQSFGIPPTTSWGLSSKSGDSPKYFGRDESGGSDSNRSPTDSSSPPSTQQLYTYPEAAARRASQSATIQFLSSSESSSEERRSA